MLVEKDFRLQLATLGDELVDDKRSSVIVYQVGSIGSDDEESDEEKEAEDRDESKIVRRKMVVANLIPNKVTNSVHFCYSCPVAHFFLL